MEGTKSARTTTGEDAMLRYPEVERRSGLSRVTIWRKVRAGTFPAPRELGPNSVGWLESEIEAWRESRPRRGPTGPTGLQQTAAKIPRNVKPTNIGRGTSRKRFLRRETNGATG